MQWLSKRKDSKEYSEYNKEEFIERVVKKVHFAPDRYDIQEELAGHIEDSMAEMTEKEALARMGDPDVIGMELNKQHNPIIGYLWYFSRIPLVLLSIIIAFQLLALIAFSGFDILFIHPSRHIPKDEYLRSIKPNEKIVVDDRHMKITHIIQTKDGTLHVCYNTYNLSLTAFSGWSGGGLLGTIKDEDGNYYHTGGGSSSGSFYKKSRWFVRDFPLDKELVILEYDAPDRYFKIEFNLGEVAQEGATARPEVTKK